MVGALQAQGIRRISCVPGESFLPILDALIDSEIALDVARHEAGAGNMAVANARLSGHAGVVMVSRGPGAMHAAIAVHTAEQDAIPLVVLIGQVALRDRGRGGFQEMNYAQVFGSVAKWVASLDIVERIPETIARAIRVAESGRPGPVVIEMPEDVLDAAASAPDVTRRIPMRAAPAAEDIDAFHEILATAEQPVLILGRGIWSQATADAAAQFAQKNQIPVVAGFRCQDFIDNDSPFYVGHVGLSTDIRLIGRLEEADVVVSVGGHFGDAETKGYEILRPRGDRTVVHVSVEELDVDRYLPANLVIQATPLEFFQIMNAGDSTAPERHSWVELLRNEELERSSAPADTDRLTQIMTWLRDSISPDTIIANGAGNYAIWVHQYLRYRRFGTQLAPASGAMGFGLPAGIAAGLERPEQPVIAFAGDGCLTMSLSELATLAETRVNVTVVVINNGIYGTIHMHQRARFPGRAIGTSIEGPDFVALANSFGIHANRVTSLEAFQDAFSAAREMSGPALIEVVTDPTELKPRGK